MTKSSAKFSLLYTKTAVRDIRKLDIVVQKKIQKKLKFYADNPFFYAKKLTNFALGSYRWRIGNYRIVFDINRNNIIILRAGHRKEIYQ